ncbi:MAG: Oligopeptide transport ATP-binding protein OppD [Tenericutes bacterium ADurb.BinA155]|nr:MAG: Oligopeptide transport ATP-binding protein OppD [Tenericutes bacterium ADurb.BinA155]
MSEQVKQKLETIDFTKDVGPAPAGKEVILSVRNLAISFFTDNGMVRAVRGVSFDLYKGETLCIVGESGSGKSVTSKTLMGILAGNAHIDSGSVMYEGEDLTKVSEEEFHRIRGHKIGMIFQDPLSSLNPIMRIGKQITETMLINGNHLHQMFTDLIATELVDYKNTVNLISIEKREIHLLRKNKKLSEEDRKAKIAASQEKIKGYQTVLGEKKAALNAAKAAAKKKVDAYHQQLKQEHQAKEKVILKSLFTWKNTRADYAAFISERRRYVSQIRVTKKEAKDRAIQIMREVGIPEPERRFKQYPFEFSGGMRQRIVIAIALTADPEVLICDEPTTALDVTIQAQILELINRLKAARHMSCIFITHDLGVVANMADRVAVMYAGKIVEYGSAKEIFYQPAHPYTWALLSSIPDIDSKERLEAIPGTPPNMLFPPKGDAFALRSKYAMGIDFKEEPPMFQITPTHYCSSWLLDERAPKAVMPRIVEARIMNSLKKAGVNAPTAPSDQKVEAK